MKTLILYYSFGGNTRKIAEMIQQQLGGDMEEIQTVKPYTGSYQSIVDQGQNLQCERYSCLFLGHTNVSRTKVDFR